MKKTSQKGSIRASIQTPHQRRSTQAALSPQPANARTYIGFGAMRSISLFSRINARIRSVWELRMYARPITYTGIFFVALASSTLGCIAGYLCMRLLFGR